MFLSRPRTSTTLSRLLLLHRPRQFVYSFPHRILSSSSRSDVGNGGAGGGEGSDSTELTEAEARKDAYNQLQNLDFMKAAKILFTAPPKHKKFGFDFHLVQFFFACLPSLAVFLLAQYARREMKKFDEELEVKNKNKAEDEQKAKHAELESLEKDSDKKLSKVMERLDAIEEAVKEIVHEKSKSANSSSPSKPAEQNAGPKKNSKSETGTKK
ncbi:stress response NST1-like protein [Rhynchospora pubera]|uniref:Stress response NST1-like protein n=1 Tax=Rhynchospora pubera TaxID=906938 RepID=A0AAV8FEQ9_9POAL|nr:stress response NST1-like protein [Rhynchospora pubera]